MSHRSTLIHRTVRAGVLAALALVATTAAAAPLPTRHVPQSVTDLTAARVATPDAATELTVAIALPMRNLDALKALVADLYDPASPNFRHYLSVEQFTERFGPTEADYAAAVRFFKDQGLTITHTAANRYLIDAKGSVATLERALHVQFGLYQHPTEARTFIAPDREPTPDLSVPLLQIIGLDTAELPKSRLRVDPTASAGSGTGSGPGGQFLGSDVRAAYYGGTTLTGAGQSVGLMELGPYNPSNIQNYFTKFGPPLTTQVVPISTDGTTPTCSGRCGDAEQALDIEYAIAMAPGLAQVQVYVAGSAESVLNRMASDNTSAQLSTSWGWNENRATDEPIFLQMAAQGQTLLTASGDYSSLKASGPWPEESAYITGVGGTDLVTTGPGGAWAGETGWSGSAGGPSVDPSIKIPSYQKPFINAANGGSTTVRNVPDIAGDANTDNYICAGGTCGGGNGGTSFASPIWSGYIALANEAAAQRGKPRIGFLNPFIYKLGGLAKYDTLFHDTVGGTSGKFTAVKGFDLVTGFGSPNGAALIQVLSGR